MGLAARLAAVVAFGNRKVSGTSCFVKNAIIMGVLTTAILTAGCGKRDGSSGTSATRPIARKDTVSSPVAQPALAAWKRGDQATAVSSFVAADWSVRPLFAPDSVLNLSEDEFKALSNAGREAKAAEMIAGLDLMKKLVRAVDQVGRDAASQGDPTQARRYFTSLKQRGTALDSPDRLKLVQIVGKSFKKLSDKELAKIEP